MGNVPVTNAQTDSDASLHSILVFLNQTVDKLAGIDPEAFLEPMFI